MNEKDYSEIVKRMRQRTYRLDREGDYWTQEEKERLAKLFADGVGVTAIAILLQRTEPAIHQQIEKQDLYEREEKPVRRRREDKEPECLCRKCPSKDNCQKCHACQVNKEDK